MSSSIRYENARVEGSSGESILCGVQLAIAPGESIALVGQSGAGKTTALRLVNGLVPLSSGRVLIDEVDVSRHDLVTLRRRTGYMIQGVGLFPHRSVYENVATVPRLLGWPEERIRAAASSLLDALAMPLEKFGSRKPRELSGGERQRTGIARALVAEPAILLCDEPFGALDPILRREQQQAMNLLRERVAVTLLFVTHDLREAFAVAGRVALFEQGRVAVDLPVSDFRRSSHPLAQAFLEASGGLL